MSKPKEVLRDLEWSDTRQGVQLGDGSRGLYFPACPMCGGVTGEVDPTSDHPGGFTIHSDPHKHFPPGRIGHKTGCRLKVALDLGRQTP